MPFAAQAILSGGGTVSLTDGAPFEIVGARGFAGPQIRRVAVQGPAQFGETDAGYRLDPRTLEIDIGFQATTDATLDTYRDTLMAIFKPMTSTPINLRVTRDDGEIRQLDCYREGDIKLDLLPGYRPGHYHRATVRLRAADPAWYELAPGTVTSSGTPNLETNWYLAGSAIGSAQVMMQGSAPTQGTAWSYTGTIPATSSWTLALRMPQETLGTSNVKYAFRVVGSPGDGLPDYAFFTTSNNYFTNAGNALGSTFMQAGTANYFFRYDYNGVLGGATNFRHLINVNNTDATYAPPQCRGQCAHRWHCGHVARLCQWECQHVLVIRYHALCALQSRLVQFAN